MIRNNSHKLDFLSHLTKVETVEDIIIPEIEIIYQLLYIILVLANPQRTPIIALNLHHTLERYDQENFVLNTIRMPTSNAIYHFIDDAS